MQAKTQAEMQAQSGRVVFVAGSCFCTPGIALEVPYYLLPAASILRLRGLLRSGASEHRPTPRHLT